jgi:hypothetical protein
LQFGHFFLLSPDFTAEADPISGRKKSLRQQASGHKKQARFFLPNTQPSFVTECQFHVTGRSSDSRHPEHSPSRLPSGFLNVPAFYSGATVQEFHPLPYSPVR